jgi:hypothetical protein
MQFYDIFPSVHICGLIDIRLPSNITWYRSDCLYECMKIYSKTACTILQVVCIWLFEIFQRKYNYEKSVHFVCSCCLCISKCTLRKTEKYSSTLSLTSSLNWLDVQHHASAALTPGNNRYSLYRRLCWPKSRDGRVRKISPPLGFDSRTVQPVASQYSDCPRKGIWLLYHVLPQVESGTERLELSYVLWFLFPFVSYDKPTCSCSVSGPVVASWGLSAVI